MSMGPFLRLACIVACAIALRPACAAEPGASENKPQIITQVKPHYPDALRRANVEGSVVARLRVDAEGNVRGISIRRSPHELLSDAVEEALWKWKYRPMMKDGKPVGFTTQFEINFRLRDESPEVGGYGVPPPSAEEVAKYVAMQEGVETFRSAYWSASSHKAFAASDDGAWSWVAGVSTIERAGEAAREGCERYRAREHRPCKVVNVDGRWKELAIREPTPLRLLPDHEIVTIRRETVESWPDEKKERIVPFLAKCRASAEVFINTFKTNDPQAVYRAVAQELRDQYSAAEFAEMFASMKQAIGSITSTTFRQQSLLVPRRDEETLAELHSQVVYTASTPVWQNPGIVLILRLSPDAGECRVGAFTYLALSGEVPPWLRDDASAPPRGT
jgi:TonB family protein